jgi:tRNA(Ile)-lysidine synthase
MLRQVLGAAADSRTEIVHDGAALRVYRGGLFLERKTPAPDFEPLVWAGEPRLVIPSLEGELRFRRALGQGIDAARLAGRPVMVRLRRGGERLQPHPRRPGRPLKDLFQEAGVPPWRRARLPMLFCGEDLVWVPGLGVDAAYLARGACRGIVPQWRSRSR